MEVFPFLFPKPSAKANDGIILISVARQVASIKIAGFWPKLPAIDPT